MSLIVVMEDDDTLRLLISSILKKSGYTVFQAPDGLRGLELVRRHKPDLVVSDVQMPEMDGVTMLTRLREEPEIAHVPVILLTSLGDRAHVRTGMTSGADDYLTKPFLPDELRDAAAAQLARQAVQTELQSVAVNSAVKSALDSQRHSLATVYERRLQKELSGDRWPSEKDSPSDEKYDSATILFVDLISQALPEVLSTTELTDTMKRAYTNASDTVHLFGARHVHLVGEGLLAVFAQDTDTASVNHSMRAARSAFGLVKSVQQTRLHLEAKFSDRQLPPFEVGVAMHSGPVTIARMADPLHGSKTMILPVGDTINLAMLLQKQTAPSGWTVVCTEGVLSALGSHVLTGRRADMRLRPGGISYRATELIGLKPIA